jgi:hypothetical protein
MGFWEFLAKMIDSLAWPSLAAYVVYLLRGHGHELIRFVEKIRVKDFEVTLRQNFEEGREAAEQVRSETNINTFGTAETSTLTTASKIALEAGRPDVAILDVWKTVEQELTKIIQHEGMMRWVSPGNLIHWAHQKGLISNADRELFDRLRRIRNEVVHSNDVRKLSNAEVYEFADLASVLIARLKEIEEPLKGYPLPKDGRP